ncbi:MAG: leucine-rich repeat domain-containing protein [Bacilli bacterium]|nr:leucine-rich repeat domain-containing protein [Bacilli bacterium]
MENELFAFKINKSRDYGEPDNSYALVDILKEDLEEVIVPETHNGKPVVLFDVDPSKRYPNVKSIVLPSNKFHLSHRTTPESFPSLERIEVIKEELGRGLLSEEGVLYYGRKGDLLRGLLFYPANRPGTEFEVKEKTYLRESCFAHAKNLERVILPSGAKDIPDYAFASCEKLMEMDVPGDVSNIGSHAFHGCVNLEKITFHPEDSYLPLTILGAGAFAGCAKLKQIKIPSSVKSAGRNLFRGCSSLERVDGNFSGYRSIDGVIYSVAMFGQLLHLYLYPASRKSVDDTYEVNEEVEFLHDGCFYETRFLKKVILPKGVTSIESMSFSKDASVKEIIYKGSKEDWERIEKPNFPENIKVTCIG